jgi:hypothetical protein
LQAVFYFKPIYIFSIAGIFNKYFVCLYCLKHPKRGRSTNG